VEREWQVWFGAVFAGHGKDFGNDRLRFAECVITIRPWLEKVVDVNMLRHAGMNTGAQDSVKEGSSC